MYVDDILIAEETFDLWLAVVEPVLHDVTVSRIRLGLKKAYPGPYSRVEFLGVCIGDGSFSIPLRRRIVVGIMLHYLIRGPRRPFLLRCFLGHMGIVVHRVQCDTCVPLCLGPGIAAVFGRRGH